MAGNTTAVANGPSKADHAYGAIKQRIESGAYRPGHRLVLDQLARDLEVSPVPVREAVRRLEAEGYVEFTRNLGARVATIDEDQYEHAMQALAVLEGAATALAVPHLTAGALRRARQLNRRMRPTTKAFDPVLFTDLNHQFHQVLCDACPNPHLRGLLEREWSRLGLIRRSTFAFVPERATSSVAEHDQLLDLIGAGASSTDIEQAARAHKLQTLRAFLDHESDG